MRSHFKMLLLALICALQVLQYANGEQEKIIDIDNLFEVGDKEVELNGQDSVVMLVGGTGTGKSTLSKFLRRDPTLKIQQNEAEDYVFADGEEKIGNKNNHRSKTLFPHVDKDQQSGAQLVDCAGFEDTRHPMYDLLASFFTQKVFNKAQKMKIVVVESFERMRLGSDRTAFVRSIKQLAQLLQDDVAAFKDSIGLVATKADSTKSDEQLTKSVTVFLRGTIESLQMKQEEIEARGEYAAVKALERQIQLVQFLAAGDKVAIFRRPNDLQSPWTLTPLRKNFNQIRDLIFTKLQFLDTTNQQFQVSVAPETVIYIQNTLLAPTEQKVKVLLKETANFLIKDFDIKLGQIQDSLLATEVEKRRTYSQIYSEEFSNINSTKSLIDFFKSHDVNSSLAEAADLETRKFLFLHAAIGSDVDTLLNDTTSMFENGEKVQSHAESWAKIFTMTSTLLEHSGKYEIYAKNAPFQSEITNESYKNFISHLNECGITSNSLLPVLDLVLTRAQMRFLNKIRSERLTTHTKKELRNNFVSYTGRYILATEIKDMQSIEGQLLIVATHKFFLDKNLELIDAHLTILAPVVEVVAGANRTITMRGSSGFTSRYAAAEGMRGSDGPSGYSSGDINIFALDVTNAVALQIRSFGGSGADGQAGGKGADGKKSVAPYLHRLEGTYSQISYLIRYHQYEINSWSKYSPEKKYWVAVVYNEVTNVEKSEIVLVNNKQSAPPTNGGDGGNGGAGAPPGDKIMVLANTETEIGWQKAAGTSGVGGRGGAGGRSAPICAKTRLTCEAKQVKKNLIGFIPLNNPEFKIECRNPFSFDCETYYRPGFGGKNGSSGRNFEMQRCKHPVNLAADGSVNLHIYNEAVADDAALEKSGKLEEFLEFLSSLVQGEEYDEVVMSAH